MTVNRNLALIETMKAQLEGREKAGDGKKTAKPQDVVRMYDNIIQNMEDITELAGLETDEDLAIAFYLGRHQHQDDLLQHQHQHQDQDDLHLLMTLKR